MKVLELKDIAGYLPHTPYVRLKGDAGVYKAIGFNSMFQKVEISGGARMHEKHSMKEIKLYLRPMSDLAREITHRGETVVPIVAIGNLIGYENLTAYEFDGRVEYGWGRQCYDDSQGYSFGWHTASMAFGVWADCIDEGWPTVQTEMMTVHVIDWLNAHFFDYRGLIDAGLAIDVNTLPENPYEK